jgi:hypothetical protein
LTRPNRSSAVKLLVARSRLTFNNLYCVPNYLESCLLCQYRIVSPEFPTSSTADRGDGKRTPLAPGPSPRSGARGGRTLSAQRIAKVGKANKNHARTSSMRTRQDAVEHRRYAGRCRSRQARLLQMYKLGLERISHSCSVISPRKRGSFLAGNAMGKCDSHSCGNDSRTYQKKPSPLAPLRGEGPGVRGRGENGSKRFCVNETENGSPF